MSRVLITNGGPHSSDTWAMATAEEIFDIAGTVSGERLMAAQRFRLSIAELLAPHHEQVQVNERDRLAEDVEHIHTPHSAEEYLDDFMAGLVALAKDSPWQEHFNRPEVQDAVRQVVAVHLVTNQHTERLWHANRNPDCEVSQAYRAKYHRG